MDNRQVEKRGRSATLSEAEKKQKRPAYVRNTPWECTECSKEYTTGGKWSHLSTRKHYLNYTKLTDEVRKRLDLKAHKYSFASTVMQIRKGFDPHQGA